MPVILFLEAIDITTDERRRFLTLPCRKILCQPCPVQYACHGITQTAGKSLRDIVAVLDHHRQEVCQCRKNIAGLMEVFLIGIQYKRKADRSLGIDQMAGNHIADFVAWQPEIRMFLRE